MEGSGLRWREAIAGRGNGLRWRGAIAGGVGRS